MMRAHIRTGKRMATARAPPAPARVPGARLVPL